MLKQPLLSRMFKLSEAASSSATEQTSEKPDTKDLSTGTTTATPDKATQNKATKRLSATAIGKGLAVGGVLSAAAGFALMRYAPMSFQAAIMPSRRPVAAPLSQSDDPSAEPVTSTGDLFLTNQILYRKLEAIAGVTLSAETAASPGTLPGTSAGLTADNAQSAQSQGNGAKTDQKAAQKTQEGDSAEPNLDEQVVAIAPPAPAAAPVEFTGTTIDSVLEMRVAVAKDVPAIGFATSKSGAITDLDGNTLKELSSEQGVTAEISGGIVIDGQAMPSAFWIYPEDGGYVAVGDSWYRGRVLIALRDRGLIAVNHVLLGDYLYSVVGSEMSPSWSIESLKAQAVAARSYALTHNIHPASKDYFDLDNTQRFQAYKGISREANTTQAAVQATAGEFISHEGGIVESLYAASQAIVDDAHKGSGMSQLGAKDLAEQGYSYQEILAHYYPGTALGRLETEPG